MASDAIITSAAVSPKKEVALEGITLRPARQKSFTFADVGY